MGLRQAVAGSHHRGGQSWVEPGHGEQGEMLLLCPWSPPAVPCTLHSNALALLPCSHPPSPPCSALSPPQRCPGRLSHCRVVRARPPPWAPCQSPPAPHQSPFVGISAVGQKYSPYQSPSELGMLQPLPDGLSPGRAQGISHGQGDFIPWVSSHILPGCHLYFWSCLITPVGPAFKDRA